MFRKATSQTDSDFGPVQNATLGVGSLLALVSVSCCVLPIGLSILGFGGAWLSFSGAFIAWRIPLLVLVGGMVIWSWARLVLRPACERHRTGAFVLVSIATLAFLIAASAPLWETDLLSAMSALRGSRS